MVDSDAGDQAVDDLDALPVSDYDPTMKAGPVRGDIIRVHQVAITATEINRSGYRLPPLPL